jgi:arylsulfatase
MGLEKMPDVVNGYKWELYNIADDYSESNDLAAKIPHKLRDMQQLFLVEAAKYNVFPLDNTVIQRAVAPRPSGTAGRDTFIYSGEMSGLDPANAPSILNRSYTITAEVDIPQGGGDGMLVTLGGRFGGYGLYMLKGKVEFL